jgi:hypothetical protein
MKDNIREVAKAFKEGNVSRRDALKSLFRVGLSAPAAYAALGIISDTGTNAQQADAKSTSPGQTSSNLPPSLAKPEEYIAAQSKLLASIAAHPIVQQKLKEMQDAPESERPALATQLMETIRGLPELQENSTNELRLSLRVFENEHNKQKDLAVGELSKNGVVTATGLKELNAKLEKQGVGPSVATRLEVKNKNNLAMGVNSGLGGSSGFGHPIPGLIPPGMPRIPNGPNGPLGGPEGPLPGPPIPGEPHLPNTPIPQRPLDPAARTICGSIGWIVCGSIGG